MRPERAGFASHGPGSVRSHVKRLCPGLFGSRGVPETSVTMRRMLGCVVAVSPGPSATKLRMTLPAASRISIRTAPAGWLPNQ